MDRTKHILSYMTAAQQRLQVTANRIAHLLPCAFVFFFFKGDETNERETEYRAGAAATAGYPIRRGRRRRQPGKETRKCNSGRLSEYDVPGSRSICSQALERRAGWHGGSRG